MEEPTADILKPSRTYSSSSWITLNKVKKTLDPEYMPEN
jgi:hypothetical protein